MPDPGRADRGALASGGRAALRVPAAPARPGRRRSSTSRTASTRCTRSRTACRCCATAPSRARGADDGLRPARARRGDGRPGGRRRSAGRRPARGSSAPSRRSRSATPARPGAFDGRRPDGLSRARSWRSTASSAPARRRSPRRRSACASWTPATLRVGGEPAPRDGPGAVDRARGRLRARPTGSARRSSWCARWRRTSRRPRGRGSRGSRSSSSGGPRPAYRRWHDELSIRSRNDPMQPIGTLSGGNQQKVVLGRWLERGSPLLVMVEPTRGVDVGARAEIYRSMRGARLRRRRRCSISTSDYEEVVQVADRALVMARGSDRRRARGRRRSRRVGF